MSQRNGTEPHPIVAFLIDQGRTQAWVARKTGYSLFHLNRVFHGRHRATPELRRRCSEALDGVPESALFHPAESPRQAA